MYNGATAFGKTNQARNPRTTSFTQHELHVSTCIEDYGLSLSMTCDTETLWWEVVTVKTIQARNPKTHSRKES